MPLMCCGSVKLQVITPNNSSGRSLLSFLFYYLLLLLNFKSVVMEDDVLKAFEQEQAQAQQDALDAALHAHWDAIEDLEKEDEWPC